MKKYLWLIVAVILLAAPVTAQQYEFNPFTNRFDITQGNDGPTFETLPDTPASITADQFVKGNGGGTALEFTTITEATGNELENLVEDTTPQLGGDLDVNGNNLDFPTTVNISDVLDEDDMASDSATVLATQQSIKAYVDTWRGVTYNFIADGDFEQWPEGTTISSPSGNDYGSMFSKWAVSGTGVIDFKRSTDVPTVAESSHASNYSLQVDVTTADSSIAAGDRYSVYFHITGHDFKMLHQETVTLSFWVKSPKTGIHCIQFRNGVGNRSYVTEYTVDSPNTWEKETVTLSLDVSGTWYTDNQVGMTVGFTLAAGSNNHGTGDTWLGSLKYSTSNQVNVMDSATNNFHLAQVQLNLGSVAFPFQQSFVTPSGNDLEYYIIPVANGGTTERIATGQNTTTDDARFPYSFGHSMRTTPSMILSAVGHFDVLLHSGSSASLGSLSMGNATSRSVEFTAGGVTGAPFSSNSAPILRAMSASGRLLLDARH